MGAIDKNTKINIPTKEIISTWTGVMTKIPPCPIHTPACFSHQVATRKTAKQSSALCAPCKKNKWFRFLNGRVKKELANSAGSESIEEALTEVRHNLGHKVGHKRQQLLEELGAVSWRASPNGAPRQKLCKLQHVVHDLVAAETNIMQLEKY